jgi:glycosyltransferase involved in cell wall biosynthesis
MERQHAATISAVIPCFNRAGFIRAAIESVLAQTSPVLELLIVDDGSTDASVAEIEPFLDGAGGIPVRLIRLPRNQGVSAARNAGIAAATGDWIAFLDSDDRWLPHHNEVLLNSAAAHPEARMIFSDGRFAEPSAAAAGGWSTKGDSFFLRPGVAEHFRPFLEAGGGRVDRAMLLLNACGSTIPTCSCMVERSALLEAGGFRPGLRFAEDRLCWITLMLRHPAAFSLTPTSEVTYHSDNSTSPSKLAEMLPHTIAVTDEIIGLLSERDFSQAELDWVRSAKARSLEGLAYAATRAGLAGMRRHRAFLGRHGKAYSAKDWARGLLMSLRLIR